jgi:hypothetical protein
MTADGFDATFTVRLHYRDAWPRLTGLSACGVGDQLWLAGFDSSVTVVEAEPPARLHVTKNDEPCAGTDIVVTLEDDETGTRVHVVQSGFGDWLADRRETMAVGWRCIVADLQAYLATGARVRRFATMWVDLGAEVTAADGGIRVTGVRHDGLAARLGLVDGDLLVALAGAPVISLDELTSVLCARQLSPPEQATWVRSGLLMETTAESDR